MNDLKLDSLSQYVLYYFKERRCLSLRQLSFLTNTPMETFASVLLELWHEGYISSADTENMTTIKTDQAFTITPKGYLFLRKKKSNGKSYAKIGPGN